MKKLIWTSAILSILASCQKEASVEIPPSGQIIPNLQLMELESARISKDNPTLEGVELGLNQTPINITVNNTVKYKSDEPIFNYTSTVWDAKTKTVTVDGKTESTLQVSPIDKTKNYVLLGKKNGTEKFKFVLDQFHFHTESEHAIQGKREWMEVHMVHIDKMDINNPTDDKYLVIGVMIKKGAPNSAMESLIKTLPTNGAPVEVKDFNTMDFIPTNKNLFYQYYGSLTTPSAGDANPDEYKEGLTWILFKGFKTVSQSQFDKYKSVYTEHNARPIQALNNRIIYEHVGSK